MTLSKQAFEHVGVTEHDYKRWCYENGKPAYSQQSKKEFFRKIQMKELIKDKDTGKLISVVNSDKSL